MIPIFLQKALEHIELEDNIVTPGIYRVSPAASQLTTLISALNRDHQCDKVRLPRSAAASPLSLSLSLSLSLFSLSFSFFLSLSFSIFLSFSRVVR